jgi:putative transposase
MAESFFGSVQLELLDGRRWASHKELPLAVFDYIEAFYNPTCRHSSIGDISPVDYKPLHSAAALAA